MQAPEQTQSNYPRWLMPASNFILALVATISLTIFAFIQDPHPDAFHVEPSWASWDFWRYPIERNAFRRLPVIGSDLHNIAVSADGSRLWAVGEYGSIAYSHDSGEHWQIATIASQTGGYSQAATSNPSAAQSANAATPDKTATSFQSDSPAWPLTGISFIDSNRGWAVGGNGTILNSVDGGKTWQAESSGTPSWLTAVQFLSDGQRGWAVGDYGTILSSTDGGNTWQAQSSDTQASVNALQFLSDGQRGWAVGNNGTILNSTDGGNTWQAQNSGTRVGLNAVQFLGDGQHGWAVGGDGTILSSTDGGNTWQARSSGTQAPLKAVQFLSDGQRGWAVGNNGTILSSTDDGKTWQAQSSGTQASVNAVQILSDGQRGWAVGDNGIILSSADGGKTWQAQSRGTQASINAEQFLSDGQRGWAVGNNGTILSSADGGKTWQAQRSGTRLGLSGVQVLGDGKRGWAVGGDGTILSSTDGGKTWQTLGGVTQAWLNAVQFLSDGQHGWAVGGNGTILSSTDGGETWQNQNSGTQTLIYAVQFLGDGQRGWAVGGDRTILTSTNGGKTWQAQSSGTQTQNFYAVQFLSDGQRGWAVGDNGTILSSADGGKTWQAQNSGTQTSIYAVHFLGDGLRGWAVGDNGIILSSDDGGKTWQAQRRSPPIPIYTVQFLSDGQRGWAAGNNGTILSSVDGGKTWQDIQYLKMPVPWFYVLIFPLLAWLVVSGRRLLKALAGELGPELTAKKLGLNAVGTSDNPGGPASVDYLGSLQLARDIADFVRNEHTTPPLTLAITGDWGSGKSTVMTYLQAQLRRAGMRPVLYNAWHHQEEQQVLGSILECVRQQATPRWWPWLLPALWFRVRSLIYRRLLLKLLLLVLLASAIFLLSHADRQQTLVTGWHDVAEQLNLEKPAFLTGRGYNKLCPAQSISLDKPNPTDSKTALDFSVEECQKLVCLVQPQLKGAVSRPEHCKSAMHFNNDEEFFDEVQRVFGLLTEERRQLISAQLEHAGDSKSSLPFWLITGLGGLMPLILLIIKASSMFGLGSTDLLKSAAKTVGLAVPAEPVGTRQIWQRKFQRLTQLFGINKPLVLFIDDLDRCQREHVMRVLETLNFLVNAGDLYVILAVAPKYVLANVKLHFEDLAKALHDFDANGEQPEVGEPKAKPRNLARFYLQKLINIEVPVPQATTASMRKLLFAESGEVDQDAQREEIFQKLGAFLSWGLQIALALVVMVYAAIYQWPDSEKPVEAPTQSNVSGSAASAIEQSKETLASNELERLKARTSEFYFRPAPETWPTDQQLWGWSLGGLILICGLFVGAIQIKRNPKRWQQLQAGLQKIGKSLRREFIGAEPLQDSDAFKEALEIWMPLIVADRSGAIHAPRTVRAFLNRLRFLAARWPKEKPNGEAQLVGLAALFSHFGDDYMELIPLGSRDVVFSSDHMNSLADQVKPYFLQHRTKFGGFDENDINLFKYLISGLEIHKP